MNDMIHHDRVKKVLLQHKILAEKEIDDIIVKAKRRSLDVLSFIISQKKISERDIYSLMAADYGVPFVNLKNITIPEDLLALLPESLVQTHEVVIFDQDDQRHIIKVATTDPDDLQTIDFISKKTEYPVEVYLTTPESIGLIIQQYHKHIEEAFASFRQPLENNALSATEINKDVPIIKIFDTVLDYAIFQDASDIHIEPTDQNIIIRFRIDGTLRDVMSLPPAIAAGMVARVKILSHLKLDEHRLPQDGRFTIVSNAIRVAFRVSILPVYNGEKMVLRILKENNNLMTLEQLGFNQQVLEIIRGHIKKPHGMILATGPTGSGKTTTLYTMMNILNTPDVNISTIEDPIEYRMPRINQSQVSPKIGFTFASGLRALLRQDPNIIMVGEIRDNETAQIACNAAMTGHLVLSTLHTNDAIGTIYRLTEMDIPSFLVASTVNLVIAQRLVRKICKDCVQSYKLSTKQIAELSKQLSIKQLMAGLRQLGEYIPEDESMQELNFYRGKGCNKCGDTGYKGRIGIYEVLEINESVSEAILNKASKQDLYHLAVTQGMITMIQDGFVKAKQGITSIEEILRVTKE